MKKLILLILVVILSASSAYILSHFLKNMQINYIARDLPQSWLIIVKPYDPEFEVLARQFLTQHPDPDFDKIRPFSIFLKNNNSRAVVAHSVVWQFIDQTGKSINSTHNYINSPALTDGILLPAQPNELTNEVIPANGFVLLSIAPKLVIDGGGGGRAVDKNEIKNTPRTGYREIRLNSIENLYRDLLNGKSEVVINIDGAFFEDGGFVGPDLTNFFNTTEAHVRAKRDLVSFIDNSLKKGMPEETIFQTIKQRAEIKLKKSPDMRRVEDVYDFSTKTFANYFLRLRELPNKNSISEELNRMKNKNLPIIRKL